MTIYIVIVHVLLAVVLFLLINWIGSHSMPVGYMPLSLFVRPDEAPAFNFALRVITPVVYIIVVSATLYLGEADSFNRNIFLVVIYYFGFRLLFNIVLGRARLLNWRLQAVYVASSCTLAYFAYQQIIVDRTRLLPEFKAMANQLWIVIAGFLFLLFNGIRTSTAGTERRKRNYLMHRYARFRAKYGDLVRAMTRNPNVEALIYAVMVYEDFNRPRLYRIAERWLFRIGLARSLGVMQVQTASPISDRESVLRGSDLLISAYTNAMSTEDIRMKEMFAKSGDDGLDSYEKVREDAAARKAVFEYNRSQRYVNEVVELRRVIRPLITEGAT